MSALPDPGILDRAYGALLGLAIGDALGMPTQMLTYGEVAARYGVLDRFHPGPPDHPIAAGLPAGHVTDDTDQAVILGRLLVAGDGSLDPYAFVAALQAWEQHAVATGSADLLGPSTKRALERIAAGEDIMTAGRDGVTNGAAMRIAPVGIACAPEPIDRLVAVVAQVCRPTHGSDVAIAGAAAVAAAVSAGIAGRDTREAVAIGIAAAWRTDRDLADRITRAVHLLDGAALRDLGGVVTEFVGTSLATAESVPAALAIAARFATDPWDAARYAASLGGDSDTIAAMVGAVVGAVRGASSFPSEPVARLAAANPGLRLQTLAEALLALRPDGFGET